MRGWQKKMKSIRLENIKKSFHGETILRKYQSHNSRRQDFCIAGAQWKWKNTILRLIAGFETVDEGKIYLGDEDITHVPINERHVNTVFQNYALFPAYECV